MPFWEEDAMRIIKKCSVYVLMLVVCIFLCVGYASLTNDMIIHGSVELSPPMPDVYITGVTPGSSAGVSVKSTSETVLFASVSGSGTATFTVDVINISDKVYIYERVIDGAETQINGAYSGTDIKYEVSGVSALDEIAPNGGTLTFKVTITVPRGVTTNNYILKFNFIEKTGMEILPGFDEYKVTFIYNNGQPYTEAIVHGNEPVPKPENPTKSGYNFIGWYTDVACTRPWNFDADRASGDMTLYAGWEYVPPSEYRVTFKPNNGTVDSAIMVPAGSLITPPTPPVLLGYDFIGWYMDSACTRPWNFDTDKVNANTILYAGWEIYVPPVPPEHYITFKPNNGDEDTEIMVLTGEFIPRPMTPIMDGYVFTGWYIDESYTTAWNFEVDRVDRDMILYGGWEEYYYVEAAKYSITFKANNGTADSEVVVEEGSLIPRPEIPTRDGYVFTGWYSDVQCTTAWNFDIDKPASDMILYAGWEEDKNEGSGSAYHSDFLGLVEALLSDSNNCLNNSDVVFDAVIESLTSKKRPKEDAPILHCSVNSVSGGTMSAIASYANSKLTKNLHFIFEADSDPAYQNSRMALYMYYGDECTNAKDGDEIMVYKQIVSRGSDGVWYADGTYIGVATVGNFYGGGNSGKDVKTISPYTWKFTATYAE